MQGFLCRDNGGRWCVVEANGRQQDLDAGDVVRVHIPKKRPPGYEWVDTRIEHDGHDYYAIHPRVSLFEGMEAKTVG